MSFVTLVMLGKADSECAKLGRDVMTGGVEVLYGVADMALWADEVEEVLFVEEVLAERSLYTDMAAYIPGRAGCVVWSV